MSFLIGGGFSTAEQEQCNEFTMVNTDPVTGEEITCSAVGRHFWLRILSLSFGIIFLLNIVVLFVKYKFDSIDDIGIDAWVFIIINIIGIIISLVSYFYGNIGKKPHKVRSEKPWIDYYNRARKKKNLKFDDLEDYRFINFANDEDRFNNKKKEIEKHNAEVAQGRGEKNNKDKVTGKFISYEQEDNINNKQNNDDDDENPIGEDGKQIFNIFIEYRLKAKDILGDYIYLRKITKRDCSKIPYKKCVKYTIPKNNNENIKGNKIDNNLGSSIEEKLKKQSEKINPKKNKPEKLKLKKIKEEEKKLDDLKKELLGEQKRKDNDAKEGKKKKLNTSNIKNRELEELEEFENILIKNDSMGLAKIRYKIRESESKIIKYKNNIQTLRIKNKDPKVIIDSANKKLEKAKKEAIMVKKAVTEKNKKETKEEEEKIEKMNEEITKIEGKIKSSKDNKNDEETLKLNKQLKELKLLKEIKISQLDESYILKDFCYFEITDLRCKSEWEEGAGFPMANCDVCDSFSDTCSFQRTTFTSGIFMAVLAVILFYTFIQISVGFEYKESDIEGGEDLRIVVIVLNLISVIISVCAIYVYRMLYIMCPDGSDGGMAGLDDSSTVGNLKFLWAIAPWNWKNTVKGKFKVV